VGFLAVPDQDSGPERPFALNDGAYNRFESLKSSSYSLGALDATDHAGHHLGCARYSMHMTLSISKRHALLMTVSCHP
jgi:hypothetical protein